MAPPSNPFLEDVDVFSGPHSRMKRLVEVSNQQLHLTDFSNDDALKSLLHSLHKTFCEFKTHEQIENTFIMKKLKNKLKALSIHDAAVCNCHNDSQLSEMLALVKDGYSCTRKSHIEKLNYGLKLQRALEEFNKEFLPHMKEEEEVFQPMLMKYFGYDELKCLKDMVLKEHRKWQHLILDEKTDHEPEEFPKVEAPTNYFDRLPPEVLLHIFSYLDPRDLTRCSSVCQTWNEVAYSKNLWSNISPVLWAKGYWSKQDTLIPNVSMSPQISSVSLSDEDADFDEAESYEEWEFHDKRRISMPTCRHTKVRKERNLLNGLIQHVLPKVGFGVKRIDLAYCGGLTNSQFRSIIKQCPNITWLDVSDTDINDFAFKGLFSYNVFDKLNYLNLSGCHVSDEGLRLLSQCFTELSSSSNAKMIAPCEKYLSNEICQSLACFHCPFREGTAKNRLETICLSGCYRITDSGLGYLLDVGLFEKVTFLDVSGCWQLTGPRLKEIISRSPFLPAANLFYCSEIEDGPYELEANGCQNLGSNGRACCRSHL